MSSKKKYNYIHLYLKKGDLEILLEGLHQLKPTPRISQLIDNMNWRLLGKNFMDSRAEQLFTDMKQFVQTNGPASIADIEKGLEWYEQRLWRCIKKYGLPHGYAFKNAVRVKYSHYACRNVGHRIRLITKED